MSADFIIILAGMGPEILKMLIEACHQVLHLVANHFIAVDEFLILIAQGRLQFRESGFEMEKNCSAPKEWLAIGTNGSRKKGLKLIQELRFAASPF